MDKKKKWERRYVRYIIKNPVLFYTFLLAGMVLFLSLSLSIRMENGASLLWQIFMNAGKGL